MFSVRYGFHREEVFMAGFTPGSSEAKHWCGATDLQYLLASRLWNRAAVYLLWLPTAGSRLLILCWPVQRPHQSHATLRAVNTYICLS